MVQASYVPDCVHLVGSIGLNGVEEVFSTVARRSAAGCDGFRTASRAHVACG